MDASPPAAAASTTAVLAKAAFRRLAQSQLEPTPENYARAYAEEAGLPLPPALPAAGHETAAGEAQAQARAQGAAWTSLVERLARNLERGGKQWTAARRKESLKRVLDGSRSDPQRLLQRLQSLMGAWETDGPAGTAESGPDDPPGDAALQPAIASAGSAGWHPVLRALQGAVTTALPSDEQGAAALADRLGHLADAVIVDGATSEHVASIQAVCDKATRLLGHRHHLVRGLSDLCQEFSVGLAELGGDDGWTDGQCRMLQMHLSAGSEGDPREHAGAASTTPSVRAVRAARNMLVEAREQQARIRDDRRSARGALKQLIQRMLLEVGELGQHTGRFQAATSQHAAAIASADSLESMAGVVHAMLADARTVHTAVGHSQERLLVDRARAEDLESRVRELESELRRLSEEVSTDALTQVANRRGLMQAFQTEVMRLDRREQDPVEGATPVLAIALIDIDNFKRLNDTLGHAAGDVALKKLAAAVRERLRPTDHLARFGGEEFVVLLPDTVLEEGQQAMTRLQRSLSEALFLHDGREVFVTFSAGMTAFRTGESLEMALERADQALYEAKRTGKNRTCLG